MPATGMNLHTGNLHVCVMHGSSWSWAQWCHCGCAVCSCWRIVPEHVIGWCKEVKKTYLNTDFKY
jgi:hypothetical protein